MIKDIENIHVAYVVIEHRIDSSYVYCFSGLSWNLLVIWVTDFKMCNICFGMVVGRDMLVDGAGSWSVVYPWPYSLNTYWTLQYMKNCKFLQDKSIDILYPCVNWGGILSLGFISKDLSVLHPLNIICTLVSLKILLNCLLSPGM